MNSRLIYLRKKVFKLTQQELADQLGLNRASLSQYERGHTPIPRYTIKLICLMFEINEKWFLSGEGSIHAYGKNRLPAASSKPASPKMRKYLEEIVEILTYHPEIEEHVYHYVKALITNPQQK